MLLPWLRRIVWQQAGSDRYEPCTLRLRSGGVVAFRSLQFAEEAVKLLMDEGVQQFSFAEIAEVHLPLIDPWQAYYEQLAVISPQGQSRLVRWETTGGLRVTSSGERFQAFDGPADRPDDWVHMLQPAWSLDPLLARHQSIRLRSYFLPTEVPLSMLEPVGSQRRAFFSGAWDWRIDRNCRGGALRCGREEFAWGLGVHAASALQFELPALATGLRTRVGLDRLAGRGGCARGLIFIESENAAQKNEPTTVGRAVFRSKLLIGSRGAGKTNGTPLSFDPDGKSPSQSDAARRLILVADMVAGDDRPSGADPLDIRDAVDWIEPLVTLDREQLQHEVDQHGPTWIDAWAGWKLAEGELRLANRWDKSDVRQPSYRLDVQPQGQRLALARSWKVSSITHRLQSGRIARKEFPSQPDRSADRRRADRTLCRSRPRRIQLRRSIDPAGQIPRPSDRDQGDPSLAWRASASRMADAVRPGLGLGDRTDGDAEIVHAGIVTDSGSECSRNIRSNDRRVCAEVEQEGSRRRRR